MKKPKIFIGEMSEEQYFSLSDTHISRSDLQNLVEGNLVTSGTPSTQFGSRIHSMIERKIRTNRPIKVLPKKDQAKTKEHPSYDYYYLPPVEAIETSNCMRAYNIYAEERKHKAWEPETTIVIPACLLPELRVKLLDDPYRMPLFDHLLPLFDHLVNTGLGLRARLDILDRTERNIIDWKTTSEKTVTGIKRSIVGKYNYLLQVAFYALICKLADISIFDFTFVYLIKSKAPTPPVEVTVPLYAEKVHTMIKNYLDGYLPGVNKKYNDTKLISLTL